MKSLLPTLVLRAEKWSWMEDMWVCCLMTGHFKRNYLFRAKIETQGTNDEGCFTRGARLTSKSKCSIWLTHSQILWFSAPLYRFSVITDEARQQYYLSVALFLRPVIETQHEIIDYPCAPWIVCTTLTDVHSPIILSLSAARPWEAGPDWALCPQLLLPATAFTNIEEVSWAVLQIH